MLTALEISSKETDRTCAERIISIFIVAGENSIICSGKNVSEHCDAGVNLIILRS